MISCLIFSGIRGEVFQFSHPCAAHGWGQPAVK